MRPLFFQGLTIEAGRFDRARDLEVHAVNEDGARLPRGHYMVTGGAEVHYLSVPDGRCDCNDWAWNGEELLCKHLLAALIHEGKIVP